jgi:uncharacterized protein (DUF697 family)
VSGPEEKSSIPVRTVAESVLQLVARIPSSNERGVSDPRTRIREITSTAATKAALTAGGLALPVGALGWLTILPELVAVWRIQAQMVVDIARLYGRRAELTREHMMYCLFRHGASQGVRDLVVQVGERLLIQRATVNALQAIARAVGVRVTQREVAKGVVKWLPVVGALGVGAYAYYDTAQVARTAIELFERDAESVSEQTIPQ